MKTNQMFQVNSRTRSRKNGFTLIELLAFMDGHVKWIVDSAAQQVYAPGGSGKLKFGSAS